MSSTNDDVSQSTIDAADPYDVYLWSLVMSVNVQEVLAGIHLVGPSAVAVHAYLKTVPKSRSQARGRRKRTRVASRRPG